MFDIYMTLNGPCGPKFALARFNGQWVRANWGKLSPEMHTKQYPYGYSGWSPYYPVSNRVALKWWKKIRSIR